MTTNVERTHALVYARDFLLELLDPKQTPRVPRAIRREAINRLRHYPSKWEVEQIAAGRGEIFFGKIE